MHKHFDNIPSFRPIVNTNGTRHYSAGKYLSTIKSIDAKLILTYIFSLCGQQD